MNSVTPSAHIEALYQKARTLLVLDHPFFASIVLRKPLTWTTDIPTAAMSCKTGNIYINPEWVEQQKLTAKNMIFLLAHECMHYMLLHGARQGSRKAKAWNIAADKVINDTLIDCNVGEFIDGGVTMPGARDMRAEDLYDDTDDDGDGDGEGDGDGGGIGGCGDDLLDEQMTEGEQAAAEAQAKVDMTQAKQAAKMQGKLPGALERMVDEIINVPTPWHDILERFMVSFRRDDLSWSRPNRRHIASDIYIPGTSYTPEMGPVVLAIDTSGSIGQAELDHFTGHVNRIIEDCRPEVVHVLYCDTAVAGHDIVTLDDLPYKATMKGGGGTDLREIFSHIDNEGIEPDVLVVLTDMYTPFPSEAPGYSTVWLSTSSVDTAPFGEVIHYEVV